MRVLVVGVGGLGCPASLALAAAGVRALTLVDPDTVDATNLHRQPWHRSSDVGRPKVRSAADRLRRAFPAVQVEAVQARVDGLNVGALFAAHDAVVDGTDGPEAKFLLSDAAVRHRVPLAYGGVLRFEAQAMLIAQGGPCLRCLFEAPPAQAPTCAQAGVMGSLAGVVGALQAGLLLRGARTPGAATLHRLDGRTLVPRQTLVRQAADCPACGGAAAVSTGRAP